MIAVPTPVMAVAAAVVIVVTAACARMLAVVVVTTLLPRVTVMTGVDFVGSPVIVALVPGIVAIVTVMPVLAVALVRVVIVVVVVVVAVMLPAIVHLILHLAPLDGGFPSWFLSRLSNAARRRALLP